MWGKVVAGGGGGGGGGGLLGRNSENFLTHFTHTVTVIKSHLLLITIIFSKGTFILKS